MRAIRNALLFAAVLTFGLPATTSWAAGGPGVIIYLPDRPGVSLTGAQLSAMLSRRPSNTRTYTLPASAGGPGRDVTLSTVRIAHLVWDHLGLEFFRVSVNGGPFDLRAFTAGLLSDDGHTTRYFIAPKLFDRPPIPPELAIPVEDYIETDDPSAPLQIAVEGHANIAVSASATPRRTIVGQTVTFQARADPAPPGAGFRYEWAFGDGQSVTGTRVTHTYDTAGSMLAVVSVRSLDPDCVRQCHGVAQVSVQVGEPEQQPEQTDPTPGGTSGAPQAPGSSTHSPGSGQGDVDSLTATETAPGGASPRIPQVRGSANGSNGPGQGNDANKSGQMRAKPAHKPATAGDAKPRSSTVSRAKPTSSVKRRHWSGPTISGVLIEDPGTVVRKVPSGIKTWAPRGMQSTRGGHTQIQLQLGAGGLLALVVILMGARRERRSVALRVA
jgi:hypothetical protein